MMSAHSSMIGWSKNPCLYAKLAWAGNLPCRSRSAITVSSHRDSMKKVVATRSTLNLMEFVSSLDCNTGVVSSDPTWKRAGGTLESMGALALLGNISASEK